MRCPNLDEWSIVEQSKHASSFTVSIPFSSIGSPVKVITVHLSETLALYDNELQPALSMAAGTPRLLFRHSAKRLNAHEERVATSP